MPCLWHIVKGTPKSIFMVSYGIFHYKPFILMVPEYPHGNLHMFDRHMTVLWRP